MYQINNMQHVRFIHHIYYIYLKYSATHIWCKMHLFFIFIDGSLWWNMLD